jgi:hypothetical protein
MSRGGLYVLNWAIAHPDRVSCLYLDAPVCDFKSWPGGRGKGKGSPADWKLLLKAYGFRDDAEALAYPGNPVDNLRPLAEARVPILIVSGDADDVVPFPENAGLLEDRFRRLGGSVQVILKPGVGHKHGLDDPSPVVEFIAAQAAPQADGVVTHTVESEFQKGPTVVRVLPPSKVEPGRRYRVLYILPVQPGLEPRWGDGLDEVRKLGLHDKYGLFCVAPTFSDWPWYADHPTDPVKRQESYLLRTVLQLVESRHPVLAKPEGRLLLGFSKSGWGGVRAAAEASGHLRPGGGVRRAPVDGLADQVRFGGDLRHRRGLLGVPHPHVARETGRGAGSRRRRPVGAVRPRQLPRRPRTPPRTAGETQDPAPPGEGRPAPAPLGVGVGRRRGRIPGLPGTAGPGARTGRAARGGQAGRVINSRRTIVAGDPGVW